MYEAPAVPALRHITVAAYSILLLFALLAWCLYVCAARRDYSAATSSCDLVLAHSLSSAADPPLNAALASPTMRCAAFTYSRRPTTRQQARDAAKSKDQSPAMLLASSPPPFTATKTTRSNTEEGHENRPMSLPTRGTTSSLRGQTAAGVRSQVVAGAKAQGVARGQAVSAPRPSKVQASRPHGGRHLQPPSGDNAKLKHKCPFEGCSWRFATPYKLRRHIKSHTKETPFQCSECGRGFSVRYNLLMHIQTIHSVPQKFHCPMKGCKEAFHTQPRLNGHLRRVHKKDWKQLHLSQSDTDSQAGSPCSTESLDSTHKPSPTGDSDQWFSCGVCRRDFSSQAKLSAHMRVHSTRDKTHKCSVEGCCKTFTSSDKLSRHVLTHKTSQQYRCSHDNCGRVFTRQSHLKNHMKIHLSGLYTCPVTDCGKKLSTQAQYNNHFNTHMRCQLACPHPDCQLTFPSQKRLELHTHVAHNVDHATGIKLGSSPSPSTTGAFLPHSPTPSHDQLPAAKHSGLHYPTMGHNETLENLELPDLKVEDIQAVISDNSDWSGEQVENFFNSLDLSRPDCPQSLGGSGYDSDSGYSTYDVSPIGSTIGAHYNSSLSPAITPVTPTPILSSSSPLPIASYHEEFMQSQRMLATPIAVTPQPTSDGYFDLPSLPPHSESFTDQVFTPHYPGLYHEGVPMPSSSFSFSYQQSSVYSFSSDVVPRCTPPATTSSMDDDKHTIMFIPNTYGHIPQTLGPSPLVLEPVPLVKQDIPVSVGSEPLHHPSSPPRSCPLPTTSTSAFIALNEDERQLSVPDLKERASSDSCHPAHTMKPRCPSDRTVYAQVLPTTTTALNQCKERSNLRPLKSRHGRSGSVPMKRSKRPKSQWPKSMNPGNLMAFRNFILNKLKQGQEKPLTVSGPPQPLYSHSECTNSETSSGQNSPTNIQSQYDLLADMTFNPDTLLSSDLPSSPFDLLSPSATPDDTFSVSSPDSQLFGSDIGVDFDGYAQLFSVDDLPLAEALSDSNISSDLDNIFIKSDRDPLLGGAQS